MRDFINKVNITDIISVLENEKGFGTFSEEVIISLLMDNSFIIHNEPLIEQEKTLAGINIRRQVKQILSDLVCYRYEKTNNRHNRKY